MSHAINSHVLTTTYPCINKVIHLMLMHGFVVLCISIPGLSQKQTSSSVMCTVANVILWRRHDFSLCTGSGVFTFAGNVPFRAIIDTRKKNFLEAFSPKFSSKKMFLCNNRDQTFFSDSLTSARPLGRCWNPFRLGFQHLPRGPAYVNA